MAVIIVPRLIGMRATVQELTQEVSEGEAVTVDMTATEVVAQGACDEFVRSLAQLLNCQVDFVNANERAEELVTAAAGRRQVSHLVSFTVR